MGSAITQFIRAALIIAVALVTAGACRFAYVQALQRPACDALARQQGLAAEHLVFRDVQIVTNRSSRHVCEFTASSTGETVRIEPPPDAIPYFMDTMQVVCMVPPVVIVGAIGAALVSLRPRRQGA